MGTRLDSWNGKTFLSLESFQFRNTKFLGRSVPFHEHFEQVNLRFYVTDTNSRAAVVYIKEISPKRLVCWMANSIFQENYEHLKMHSVHLAAIPGRSQTVEYYWKTKESWNSIHAECEGDQKLPSSGSLEEFLLNRNLTVTALPEGGSAFFQMEHSAWKFWKAEAKILIDAEASFGLQFRDTLEGPCHSAFISDGSFVRVMKSQKMERVNV